MSRKHISVPGWVVGIALTILTSMATHVAESIWNTPTVNAVQSTQIEYIMDAIDKHQEYDTQLTDLELEQARQQGREETRNELFKNLQRQVDSLNTDVDGIKDDVNDLKGRVSTLEGGRTS